VFLIDSLNFYLLIVILANIYPYVLQIGTSKENIFFCVNHILKSEWSIDVKSLAKDHLKEILTKLNEINAKKSQE
jgi:hypothetical protein